MAVQDRSEEEALLKKKGENTKNGYVEPNCIAARHALAILAFFGFVNVYCLRVNLSVAMVAMVNSTTSDNSTNGDECPGPDGGNSTSDFKTGEFDWDETMQGYILGSFFYGYILTQVPGGWLAARVGGKSLFGFGVFCTAALTLLTPLAARYSKYMFIAMRVLGGIGEGVTYPAMHAMWGQWAPVWERSRLVAFTYAGSQLGTVIALPISGLLCDSDFIGGWPSVFYVFGGLACIWCIAWMSLVHNTPAEHPRISQEEKLYIEDSIGKHEILPTPWKAILTSPAVLCLSIFHFASNWGFYTLLTCLPTYLKTILKFDLKENGTLSALPYLAMWFVQNVAGFMADYIRSNGYLSTKNTRKVFNFLGIILPGIMLLMSSYVGCSHFIVITILTLSVGVTGFISGGFTVNHLDIAPRFAGVLFGLTNTVATIPGILAPVVVGIMTNQNQTMAQWNKIFMINGIICLIGCTTYIIFGQGEEQEWAKAQGPPEIDNSCNRFYRSRSSSQPRPVHNGKGVNDENFAGNVEEGKVTSLYTCIQ